MPDTAPHHTTSRFAPLRAGASLIISLLRLPQRLKFFLLVGQRILLGFCDLLLAGVMYLLFLQLQGDRSAHRLSWLLPRSPYLTAWWTVALVLLRLLLDVAATYSISRFTQDLYRDLLQRLIHGYHELSWHIFVQRNRSELLKHATTTALDAAYSYQLYAEILSGSIVVCVMAASLVYQSAAIAGGLALLVILLYAFHRFILRDRLKVSSSQREQSQRSLQRIVLETFSSAKEIRSYGDQQYFYHLIEKQSGKLSTSNAQLAVLPQISRIVAEQGVVLLFLGILLMVLAERGDIHRTLSLLIFYFVVSRRMLPLISQLALLNGQLEGAYQNVEIIHSELGESEKQRTPPVKKKLPTGNHVLELEEITYGFKEGSVILNHVSFCLEEGDIAVLRGASGSGKSTLLNVIAGVAQPTSGELRIDHKRTAYVPQDIALLDDSVRANLLFGLSGASDSDLTQALVFANLNDFITTLPKKLDTRIGDGGVLFSGGQRQRLGIARAVLRRPTLLLLDESTSALDEENERQILERLAASSIAVLLVTHRTHIVTHAYRKFMLCAGILTQSAASA